MSKFKRPSLASLVSQLTERYARRESHSLSLSRQGESNFSAGSLDCPSSRIILSLCRSPSLCSVSFETASRHDRFLGALARVSGRRCVRESAQTKQQNKTTNKSPQCECIDKIYMCINECALFL